jgi:hypothetical protein
MIPCCGKQDRKILWIQKVFHFEVFSRNEKVVKSAIFEEDAVYISTSFIVISEYIKLKGTRCSELVPAHSYSRYQNWSSYLTSYVTSISCCKGNISLHCEFLLIAWKLLVETFTHKSVSSDSYSGIKKTPNLCRNIIWWQNKNFMPITVVARSKEWTVFALLIPGIVGSNPRHGCLYSVRLLCLCYSVCR